MHFADKSGRTLAVVAIVGVHAVGLYGLGLMGAYRAPVIANEPIVVRFLSEAQQPQQAKPQLPQIVPVTMPLAPTPDLPVIEIPAAPSANAITVPMTVAAPQPVVREDRAVPKLVSSVEYVREPAPHYPPQSRRLREQGLVVLRVVIDERGTACEIHIENSSGYARLDHAAREAVQRAAFRPYVEDGAPRRALVLIPIEFSLSRGSA